MLYEGCFDCDFDGYQKGVATISEEKINPFVVVLGSTTGVFFIIIVVLIYFLHRLKKKLIEISAAKADR